MYYLQSRYYNPTLGRFINADALISTGQGLLCNNMFAYCLNSPVSGIDSSGAIREDATNDQQEYSFLCDVRSGGGNSGLGTAASVAATPIAIGGFYLLSKAAEATATLVANAFSEMQQLARKLQAQVVEQAQQEVHHQYWAAWRQNGYIVIGRGLSLTEASLRVSFGGDVLCANEAAARWILVINGYWNHVGPEIHGGEGYYWHYHPNRNSHTHIWFR